MPTIKGLEETIDKAFFNEGKEEKVECHVGEGDEGDAPKIQSVSEDQYTVKEMRNMIRKYNYETNSNVPINGLSRRLSRIIKNYGIHKGFNDEIYDGKEGDLSIKVELLRKYADDIEAYCGKNSNYTELHIAVNNVLRRCEEVSVELYKLRAEEEEPDDD